MVFENKNLVGVADITANFAAKPGTDVGLAVTEFTAIYGSIAGPNIWYFTPNTSPSSGFYAISLYFDSSNTYNSSMYDYQFAILRRPDASSNAADWSVPSGSKYIPTLANQGFAKRDSMSTFSQLGIALALSPLPIHFIYTSGSQRQGKHHVQWEMNSDQYHYFKIVDALTQQELATLNALPGISQYTHAFNYNSSRQYIIHAYFNNRLVASSKIIAIYNTIEQQINVVPNPANYQLTIHTPNKIGFDATWRLLSIDGKQINSGSLNETINNIETANMANGLYILEIRKENQVVHLQKVEIIH